MKKKNEGVLAVILARIGSKRLKKKVIKQINKKTIFQDFKTSKYRQFNQKSVDEFKENLSINDLLFNYGVDSRNFVISFKNKFIQ